MSHHQSIVWNLSLGETFEAQQKEEYMQFYVEMLIYIKCLNQKTDTPLVYIIHHFVSFSIWISVGPLLNPCYKVILECTFD